MDETAVPPVIHFTPLLFYFMCLSHLWALASASLIVIAGAVDLFMLALSPELKAAYRKVTLSTG